MYGNVSSNSEPDLSVLVFFYFETCSRKSPRSDHLCAARSARTVRAPASYSVWRSLTARALCAAVMAASESEEDNKWTPEKKIQRWVPKDDNLQRDHRRMVSVWTIGLVRGGLPVCLAGRCVSKGIRLNTHAHTHTHTGQKAVLCSFTTQPTGTFNKWWTFRVRFVWIHTSSCRSAPRACRLRSWALDSLFAGPAGHTAVGLGHTARWSVSQSEWRSNERAGARALSDRRPLYLRVFYFFIFERCFLVHHQIWRCQSIFAFTLY